MTESQQNFEGWGVLEIFGHQRYAGFVRTVYYGTACMFQCNIPPLPEREQITREGCYVTEREEANGDRLRRWVPPGSTIKAAATEGYSKLFGVGAIYALTPCDEKAALKAVEEIQPRPLMLVSLPQEKALTAGQEPISRDYTCCEGNPEDGHEPGCLVAEQEDEDGIV